jgi:hypothetical protein
MSDRGFSHPNLGHRIDIEQQGNRVALVFTCGTEMRATELADDLLRQLRGGALNITVMGRPTSIVEGDAP